MAATKQDIVRDLQREILLLQGFRPAKEGAPGIDLGPVNQAFPNQVFPTGVIHELMMGGRASQAASGGFVSALLATLMVSGGAVVWIGASGRVFPPGLCAFGIEPDRVVFVDCRNEREALWASEETLKAEGLAAVVAEVREIGPIASRRLQLASEQSRVTGFLLRDNPRNCYPATSAVRWRITGSSSQAPVRDMPGLGFPRWKVELLKVRNGQPGCWMLEWSAGRFQPVFAELPQETHAEVLRRKTG